jgi:hypothetical protein
MKNISDGAEIRSNLGSRRKATTCAAPGDAERKYRERKYRDRPFYRANPAYQDTPSNQNTLCDRDKAGQDKAASSQVKAGGYTNPGLNAPRGQRSTTWTPPPP